MTGAGMGRISVAWVAGCVIVVTLGCGDATGVGSAKAPPSADEIRGALMGTPHPCQGDSECPSGVCRFDTCAGALTVDALWLQEEVAGHLADDVRRWPELAEVVVAAIDAADATEGSGRARIRARSAFVLRAIPGERTTEALAARLRDPSPAVRRQAALALTARGDKRGLPVVLLEIHVEDAQRRAEAARALGGVKDPRVVDALTGALVDVDRHVRSDAMRALREVGDQRALRPLVAVLRDGHPSERGLALTALRAITGDKRGLDPDEWQPLLP